VQTLLNALATGRVAHAYMFCGPRGTGKTTTARILAKAVNCLENGRGEPCNTCTMCQAINEGRAMDLVEIDGASNRSIEGIRDLREKINYAPGQARYKVYIIDEVHMLTEPAFNALLKTLEEPPPHAILILATTETHKVPLTILSRCQRYDFHRLSQSAIVSKLNEICEQEGITTDSQALMLVAKGATGSLRDAENLLEQLATHYGLSFSSREVGEELGLISDMRVHQLVENILNKDVAAGLATINSVSLDGFDIRQFHHALVEYLRGLLMVKAGVAEITDFPADVVTEMKQLVTEASIDEISKVIRLFVQVDPRTDIQQTLPLELALIDYALTAVEKPQKTAKPQRAAYDERAGISKERDGSKISVAPQAPVNEDSRVEIPPGKEPSPTGVDEVPDAQSTQNIDQIRSNWDKFIDACRGVGSNGNLDALLRRACEAIALEGDTLVLGFYYEYHRSKIEDRKYRHLVEKKLQDVFGVPYQVRCILTPKKARQRVHNPVVDEALRMGAKIIEEEYTDDE
ncbi:MAG: DNA polymerase III subunit gamma/tau, partial [Chloroflexota bacterium]|nr:DNA polymerase III subunit gamma/tau [Chloroflexota bacterium]